MESNYSALIEQMTNMIIRPHRDTYLADKLGPTHLIVKSKAFLDQNQHSTHKYIEVLRKDTVLDINHMKIHLSLFTPLEPIPKPKHPQPHPNPHNQQSTKKCVIYLHANSGSRVEGLELVKYVLPYGWSMAVFDYRGSGISDGDYTSMGVNQSEDLQKVMQHLSLNEQMGEYALWGRSMGAVTILFYLTKQHYANYQNGLNVSSIVLDSPFSNMRKLMYQIGANNISLPEFVFLPVVNSITEQIVSKIGFNLIAELDLVSRAKHIHEKNQDWQKVLSRINCLFLTSTQDKLVNHSHVELLHREFPFVMKELHYFNGQHNEVRSDSLKCKCAEFLCKNSNKTGEEERGKIGSEYMKGGNPTMRKSEISVKTSLPFEQSRKETQLMPPPFLKPDPCSPKLKKPPNPPFQQQKPQSASKQQLVNNFVNMSRQPKQQTPQDSKSTIIINNNFNVNVNVYGQGPIDIMPEIIPPINLKEQGGSMTDRISDNHNYNFKFYMPYTAKVQRRNYDLQGSNMSNPANISNSANFNNSLHSSASFVESQAEKEILYHSAKIEQPRMSQPNVSLQQSATIQPSSSMHSSGSLQPQAKQIIRQPSNQPFFQQKLKGQPNHIEIPRIKFDQAQPTSSKPYTIARKVDKPAQFQQKIMNNSPKVGGECFLTKKDPQAAEKQKLSLSQLRKIQKQVQQKSDLKSSKVLYVNKQKCQKQQQLLNYKKQDIFQQTQAWKYKSEQNPAQQRNRQSKDMKSMKTSLMAKRKAYERKNSEHMNSNSMKYSHMKKEEEVNQHRLQQFNNSEREGVNSQGRLLYKIKIDHL